MHYQAGPYGECKVIRCTRGAIWDAIIDLRTNSSTYLHSWATELSMGTGHMLYVPEGVAHGFLTLEDKVEVTYQMSQEHVPASAQGVRWNDPAFSIEWPFAPVIMSERDENLPDFVS